MGIKPSCHVGTAGSWSSSSCVLLRRIMAVNRSGFHYHSTAGLSEKYWGAKLDALEE